MVKKLEELNLIDNFLFEALASHSEMGTAFGRKLVEIILRKSPEKVRVVAQRTYAGSSPQLHGARPDVYLEEQPGREKGVPWSYDIEPEKDDKTQAIESLPKRVRFYHAKIDAKGKKQIPFAELQQFLNYFEHTTEENVCNRDLAELHEMVSRVKVDEEVELEYMKIFEREEMIREEGGTLCLLRQIVKKVAKGKTAETMAKELEENVDTIESLCDFI